MRFFTEFIKCYTSYIRRDPSIFDKSIPFENLGNYIEDDHIRENYEALLQYNKEQRFNPMWDIVSTMPVFVARMNKSKSSKSSMNFKTSMNISMRIMLYLFNKGQERTRDQIKKDLNLEYTDEELEALIGGDLISHGRSHYDYKITEDKTYEWVFRNMYQKQGTQKGLKKS